MTKIRSTKAQAPPAATNDASLYRYIGARLAAARVRGGVTQQQLADEVGLTRESIATIEAGLQRVPLHTFYAICAALEVEVSDALPALY